MVKEFRPPSKGTLPLAKSMSMGRRWFGDGAQYVSGGSGKKYSQGLVVAGQLTHMEPSKVAEVGTHVPDTLTPPSWLQICVYFSTEGIPQSGECIFGADILHE